MSFLGKDLRTLVKHEALPRDLTCVLEAEPGKLDIKRRKPGILFNQVTSWFNCKLYYRLSCRFNVIDDIVQKVQRHVDLKKIHEVLLDFSLLTVKAATLIFISGCGLAISCAKEGKSGYIYNLVKIK